jgi:hypothetical protein
VTVITAPLPDVGAVQPMSITFKPGRTKPNHRRPIASITCAAYVHPTMRRSKNIVTDEVGTAARSSRAATSTAGRLYRNEIVVV